MKPRIISLIAVLTALVSVAATTGGATAAETQSAIPPLTPVRAVSASFDTLAAAVGAGKLDRQVLETLRQDGAVDALVTVRYPSPAESAKSLHARAAFIEKTLVAKEAIAIAAGGDDVDVLRPYDNLPTTFVRFESTQALLDVVNASDVQFIHADTPVPLATRQSLNVIGQPQAAAAGHAGQGTYVAVIDTGTDYRRQPFGCSVPELPLHLQGGGQLRVRSR